MNWNDFAFVARPGWREYSRFLGGAAGAAGATIAGMASRDLYSGIKKFVGSIPQQFRHYANVMSTKPQPPSSRQRKPRRRYTRSRRYARMYVPTIGSFGQGNTSIGRFGGTRFGGLRNF